MFRHLFCLVPLQAVLFQKLQKFYFFPDLLNTTAQTFSSQLTDNCCKSQKGSAHVTVSNEWAKCQTLRFFVDVTVWGQPALWLGQTMSHKLIKHCYLFISLINVSFPGRPHSSISTIHCLWVGSKENKFWRHKSPVQTIQQRVVVKG